MRSGSSRPSTWPIRPRAHGPDRAPRVRQHVRGVVRPRSAHPIAARSVGAVARRDRRRVWGRREIGTRAVAGARFACAWKRRRGRRRSTWSELLARVLPRPCFRDLLRRSGRTGLGEVRSTFAIERCVCPQCGGMRRLLAAIPDPAAIERMLGAKVLSGMMSTLAGARSPPGEAEMGLLQDALAPNGTPSATRCAALATCGAPGSPVGTCRRRRRHGRD